MLTTKEFFKNHSFPKLFFLIIIFFSNLALSQMEYVEFKDQNGNIKKFSRLILGSDHLAHENWTGSGHPQPSEEQIFALMDEAVKNGINVIDTSPIYSGGIEHIIGKWLQSRKDRIRNDDFYINKNLNPDRKIYVISKGGFPFDLYYSKQLETGKHSPELIEELKRQDILKDGKQLSSPLQNVPPGSYASRLYGDKELIQKRVAEEIGHTKNNLGNDIELVYLMHRDDFDSIDFKVVPRAQTQVQKIMEALSCFQCSGQFVMLGWSNWTTDRVNESLIISDSKPNLPRPLFNSPYFSLFEMSERSIHARGIQVTHEEMMDPMFQKGILLSTYSPLGGFSILDKPVPSWEKAKEDAMNKAKANDPYWKNVYPAIFTAENEERYARAQELAKTYNSTVDQILNAYALAHSRVNFLTVGPLTIEQLKRTLESLPLSKKISPAQLDYLYYKNDSEKNRKKSLYADKKSTENSCQKVFLKN